MTDPPHDTWQALELIRDPRTSRPRHASPLHKTVANIVHDAVQAYDCGPITYLSLPGVTRQRTLLRAGSPPTTHPPPLQDVDTSDVTPETQTLAALADADTADDIGLAVVDVDTSPIGRTSAFTQRLLAEEATAPASFSMTPPALAPVLEAMEGRPHAFSVVVDQRPEDSLELAVRLVDFTPTTQIASRDAFARTQPGSLSDTIDASGLVTNWELPVENEWTRRVEDRLRADRPVFRQTNHSRYTDTPTKQALTVTAAADEYAQLWAEAPADPLAEVYEQYGVTARLTATAGQLPAMYPVDSRLYPDSVWTQVDGRAPIQVSLVTPVAVPHGLTMTDTDPTTNATKTTPATAGASVSAFEQSVRRWCLERDETLTARPAAPPGVAFQRTTADGTRTLAYLSAGKSLQPGRLLAAVWHAHHEAGIAGVSVFAPSQTRAREAATILDRPFKPPSPETLTTLYPQPTPLSGSQGVAVRPPEHPVERWVVAPDNELRCIIDGTVVASAPLTAPLPTVAEQFVCVSTDGEPVTVTHPDGATTTYERRETVNQRATPIQAPARPVHLATGRETATVYAQNGPNFTDIRHPPTTSPLSNRSLDDVATAFWETYTIPDDSGTLHMQTTLPEVVSYARHQSDRPARPPGWVHLQRLHDNTPSTRSTLSGTTIEGRTLRYTPLARNNFD
ncbi:hypothetical protein [Halobacterium salinarum]|uniref:hypothetical protein n=1 Tax=Halobacterium salinarum TaxID=2242 RepID=UPI002555AB9D|nr:hypothetical protein [Halobacterium salinarum]MDL0127828.1 hypothetical protein [Halobacterium salinarum]